MVRSPRTGGTASSSSPSSTTPVNSPAASPSGQSTPGVTTRVSRRATGIASAIAGHLGLGITSAPSTPSPLAEEVTAPAPSSSTSKTPSRVERKSHALRSVGGTASLVTSPFPGEYGGSEKCGVHEDDEADEVLMAVCGACAVTDNRALAPEDVARIAFEAGWLRPPTAAVEPTSHINVSIRNHIRRCEKATPPRKPLLGKYQLTGAVAEQSLESALHPSAFAGGTRPKGTVYYLAVVGKTKWKNPFDGLELVKPPPKKASVLKKIAPAGPLPPPAASPAVSKAKNQKKGKAKARSATPAQAPSPEVKQEEAPPPPPQSQPQIKIRLRTSQSGPRPDAPSVESASEVPLPMPATTEVKAEVNAVPETTQTGSPPKDTFKIKGKSRRPSRLYESTDESDTSSEEDVPGPSSASCRSRPSRKGPPPPINTSSSPRSAGSPRFAALGRLHPQRSPYLDLFSSCATSAFPALATTIHTAAPAHPLDNDNWSTSRDRDIISSSDSEEEVQDADWGEASEIMPRLGDGMEVDDGSKWGMDADQIQVKEATDALRVLFPMHSQEDDDMDVLQEDDMPAGGSPGRPSLGDTTARGTAFRACTSPSVALTAAPATSSPIASPHIGPVPVLNDGPPMPLSPAPSPFASDAMDVDSMWLDGNGELPVSAEADEVFSDTEVLSAAGDTPEPDRRLDTAEWARETAVSAPFSVDKDLVDYPSPILTEAESEDSDLTSLGQTTCRSSRSSSTSALSPSSRSSEIEPCDLSIEDGLDYEDMICGPESMTQADIDEDEWIQEKSRAKTPKKLPRCKSNRNLGTGGTVVTGMQQCHRIWGSIGVGTPAQPQLSMTPARALRSNKLMTPGSPRSPRPPAQFLPHQSNLSGDGDVDMDAGEQDEAIGTADLELAQKEAEEQEARKRALREQFAAKRKAFMDAYHQHIDFSCPPTPFDSTASPFDGTSGGFGSNDSLATTTQMHSALPTPTVNAMSPMALHSLSSLSLTELPTAVDPRSLSTCNLQALQGAASPLARLGMMEGEELKCNGDGVPCIPGMAALSLPPLPVPMPLALSTSPTPPASMTDASATPSTSAPSDAMPLHVPAGSPLTPFPKAAPPASAAPPVQVKQEITRLPAIAPAPAPAPAPPAQTAQSAPPAPPAQIPPAFVNGINLGRPLLPSSSTSMPHTPVQTPTHMPVALAPAPSTTTTAATGPAKRGKKGAKAATAAARQLPAVKTAPAAATTTAPAASAPTPAPASVTAALLATTPAVKAAIAPAAGASPSSTAPPASTPVLAPSAPLVQSAPVPATFKVSPPTVAADATQAAPVLAPAVTVSNKGGCKIREGITATVFANIPVFQYSAVVRGADLTVFRRLDTDWVNMTTFLLASGMSMKAITAALKQDIPALTYRTVVDKAPGQGSGWILSKGIAGTWVPLDSARELAKLHRVDQESQLFTLLCETLFGEFRRIAKFTGDRGNAGTFGQPFAPTRDPAYIAAASNIGNSAVRTPSPALAAARSALAGSAPPLSTGVPAGSGSGKAPLTRPANGAPDGCPQPKRRRATVVGQAPAKPVVPGTAVSTSAVRPAQALPGVNTPASASAPTSPKGAPLHPRLASTASTLPASLSPGAMATGTAVQQPSTGVRPLTGQSARPTPTTMPRRMMPAVPAPGATGPTQVNAHGAIVRPARPTAAGAAKPPTMVNSVGAPVRPISTGQAKAVLNPALQSAIPPTSNSAGPTPVPAQNTAPEAMAAGGPTVRMQTRASGPAEPPAAAGT